MGLFKRIITDKQEQPITTKQKIVPHLSQRDPIEKLNLTEYSLKALTHAGVQIVGQLLKLVESGEIRAIYGLRSTSILEIEVKLAQMKIADASEVEAKLNATLDQNDVFPSRENTTEKPSMSESSPNPFIQTENQTVSEGTQHIESSESQTTSEDEATTDTMLDQSSVSLSREDSIERLNLTRHTRNLLKHTDIQTVGDLLQWVESGKLQTIPALGRISILEIEDELTRVPALDNTRIDANLSTTPGQNDVPLSQENATEGSSLPQHSSNPSIHIGGQTAGERTQHIESSELQTISEDEADTNETSDQNDVSISQENATEELSLTEHSPNPLIDTDSQVVEEAAQQVESSEYQTTSEIEANTDTMLREDDASFSREDSIEKLNLTEYSFNALTALGVQTVGEVLNLVESGEHRPISTLGRKFILEIEGKLAQVKILDDSETEANTNAMLGQDNESLSQKDLIEEPSLAQHSTHQPHTDIRTVGKVRQQVESTDPPTTSEVEANTIPSQNDTYLSRGDAIEKLNLSQRSLKALKRADIRLVGELLPRVESGKIRITRGLGRKPIAEIEEKLTQVKVYDNYAQLSREDSIGQLYLRNRSFNALTRAGIQTIGEVLQLVESDDLERISCSWKKIYRRNKK